MNQADKARAAYERALAIAPDSVKAMLGLAEVSSALGAMDKATALYRRVIAGGGETQAALVGLARVHRFVPGDPEPALMAEALDASSIDADARIGLHHAAGKAAADLGDNDAAFAHFAAAKAASARTYNLDALYRVHDALIATMTPEFFAARPDYGVSSEVPVFIVGMPRSGTTLAEQILVSHSAVSGAGEIDALNRIAATLGARDPDPAAYAAGLAAMTRGQSRELARRYLETLAQFGGTALRITDKLPHNFDHVGLIALLFPQAHIVHCRRDPVATCVSCYTQPFHADHAYNTDLATLGGYYREYERIMAHWRAAAPVAILDFPYEALIAAQEEQSRALIGFLGLGWEDACLRFQETERLVQSPSQWQVRQPVYATALTDWKRYERHLAPLIAALGPR